MDNYDTGWTHHKIDHSKYDIILISESRSIPSNRHLDILTLKDADACPYPALHACLLIIQKRTRKEERNIHNGQIHPIREPRVKTHDPIIIHLRQNSTMQPSPAISA